MEGEIYYNIEIQLIVSSLLTLFLGVSGIINYKLSKSALKDKPPFPGFDEIEFWQRSEARNGNTANRYRDLGFAEYMRAMEAFRR